MEIAGALELVAVIDGKDGEQGPQGVPGQTGPAGADAYMVSISPNTVTLECDSEGNVLDNLFVSVQPKLEKGGTEISYALSNVSGGKLLAVADNGAIKIYGRLCKWSATGYDDLYTIKDYPNVAVGDIVYKVTNGEIVEHYYISSVGVVYIMVSGVRYERVVGECYAANIGTPAEVQFTIANSQYGFSRVYKFQVTADRASESPISWVESNVNNTGEWSASKSYRYSGVRRDFCYRTKVRQSDGSIGITGYVVSEYWRGQGSFTSATPPEEDNDKIIGLQKPHWKVVSYQDIGFFGSVIATLVSAQTGDFDKLIAKDCLFDNITLTGVLNNLMQTITSENASNYGYFDGTYYHINPLKIGQYVKIDSSFQQLAWELPIAFWYNNQTNIGGLKAVNTPFTLEELRQMVGKKIYIMPYTGISFNAQDALIIEKTIQYGTYSGDEDINDIPQGTQSAEKKIFLKRTSSWQPTPGTSKFLILECKAGMYNDTECIYWELYIVNNALL